MDFDGDGFGQNDAVVEPCAAPDGYVAQGGDCNDRDPALSPNANEQCDGMDKNCDGEVDETGSLDFDGSDDCVHIGDTASVDITGPITMEAWVNASDPNRDAPVIAKEYSSGRQQYWFGVYYNQFGLLLGNGGGWGLSARSSGHLPPGQGGHLASVWDGARWYNYPDGGLVDSGTYSSSVPATDEPLTIGINSSYDNTRFKGTLKDVRLWNVARTQEQIASEQCASLDATGLVGRWLMDGGAGRLALQGLIGTEDG